MREIVALKKPRYFKPSSSKSLIRIIPLVNRWFPIYNAVAIIPNYLILRWFFLIYCELKVLLVTQDSALEIGEIL